MPEYVLGIDGGNSKTDVVLASTTGKLLAWVRGPGIDSPLHDVDVWRTLLVGLVAQARAQAGVSSLSRTVTAVFCLANVDLAAERRLAHREIRRAGVAEQIVVQNDTLAVLRAGATRSWGVAVVVGAGINAVGVHPSGRIARFLALGTISGDLGGGQDIGVTALGAGVRAGDGRGPATVLSRTVPQHYGLRNPKDVAIAVHRGDIRYDDLLLLAPLVFAAAAAGDKVATGILARFADEVAVTTNALIRRLHLTRTDLEVVLGGGTLQSGDRYVLERVTQRIHETANKAQVGVIQVAPVFGAVVEALERGGADQAALRRIRREVSGGLPTSAC